MDAVWCVLPDISTTNWRGFHFIKYKTERLSLFAVAEVLYANLAMLWNSNYISVEVTKELGR